MGESNRKDIAMQRRSLVQEKSCRFKFVFTTNRTWLLLVLWEARSSHHHKGGCHHHEESNEHIEPWLQPLSRDSVMEEAGHMRRDAESLAERQVWCSRAC